MPHVEVMSKSDERSTSPDTLPPLLLTDQVDTPVRMPLWRRRLLAAAAVGTIAIVLLERPDFRYFRGHCTSTGIFTFAASPIPLLGGVPGGMLLLLCLVAAAIALWPRAG